MIRLILTILMPSVCAQLCELPWKPLSPPYDGAEVDSCFQSFDDIETWHTAKMKCSLLNARLMEIVSPNQERSLLRALQQGFVFSYLAISIDFSLSSEPFISDDKNAQYWSGGNSIATLNKWVWASSGQRIFPYVNWGTNIESPNGCLALDVLEKSWAAPNCADKLGYVCERGISGRTSEGREIIHLRNEVIQMPTTIFGKRVSIVSEVQIQFSTSAFDGTLLTYAIPPNHEKTSFNIIGE
ncbi:hypothetical protein TCAL_09949 [Tigriopus californicus]|uniref:C-type lectin domain-containing protein n=1 Tax=Tigriopus californicus TaxID=6832 RepID=A0A553PDG9_TIGCA|nr:hypothetical protein TCAL_09949 [Tigriopus californicus]|eukprot:TCALIF_09949-PA protein Name:"Protein of unknown function" AED:0.46 eAED:0.66 QI:0/1/0/1/0/0.5/2/0/240